MIHRTRVWDLAKPNLEYYALDLLRGCTRERTQSFNNQRHGSLCIPPPLP